jgi:hypothetical protein
MSTMNLNQADSNAYAGTTDTAIDIRELLYEYVLNQSSHFRLNPAIKATWPVPYTYLAMTSTVQVPVDVSGRYHHYIQVTGIAVSSGDTVALQGSIDGVTFYSLGTLTMTSAMTSAPSTTPIAADGIYYTTGNFWYIKAVIVPGSSTGATNVFLSSRPD